MGRIINLVIGKLVCWRLIFCAILFFSVSQTTAQNRIAENNYESNEEYSPNALIKLPVIPFALVAVNQKSTWVTVQYEKRLSNKSKFTSNHVIDYRNWEFNMVLNGVLVSRIPNNIQLFYRPQIRYYFGKEAYQGVFFGLYPTFMHLNAKFQSLKGNYIGGGGITGYQFFIKDKITIEANSWLSFQTANAHKMDRQGQAYRDRDTYGWLSFELSIGLPIGNRK